MDGKEDGSTDASFLNNQAVGIEVTVVQLVLLDRVVSGILHTLVPSGPCSRPNTVSSCFKENLNNLRAPLSSRT